MEDPKNALQVNSVLSASGPSKAFRSEMACNSKSARRGTTEATVLRTLKEGTHSELLSDPVLEFPLDLGPTLSLRVVGGGVSARGTEWRDEEGVAIDAGLEGRAIGVGQYLLGGVMIFENLRVERGKL